MAYPDDLLVEGERVIVHRHPHWRVLVGPVLVFLAVVGVAGYLAAVVRGQGWQAWGWPLVGGLGAALLVWLTVLPLLRWCTTDLIVTDRRLLVREGVHRWQGIQVPRAGITAVRTRRTRVGRLLGTGSLLVETEAGEELEFVDVPDTERVRELLARVPAT